MSILLTGGTGKTGTELSKLLHTSGHRFVIASRKGSAPAPYKAIHFDWYDPATFENPFAPGLGITKVYVVLPTDPTADPVPTIKPFVELALKQGVRRFVVLTAFNLDEKKEDEFPMVKVHKYFEELGVGYAIIRPSWFMENFSTSFLPAIKYQGQVPTLSEDGKVPFVSAKDIAQVAFDALVADADPNYHKIVVGPDFFTYDEALTLLGTIINKPVIHLRLTQDQMIALYTGVGIPQAYAEFLCTIQKRVAAGAEANIPESSDVVVGKTTLRAFFEENKALWA